MSKRVGGAASAFFKKARMEKNAFAAEGTVFRKAVKYGARLIENVHGRKEARCKQRLLKEEDYEYNKLE